MCECGCACVLEGRNEKCGGWRSSGHEGKIITGQSRRGKIIEKLFTRIFKVHVLLLFSCWLYQVLVAARAFLLLQQEGLLPSLSEAFSLSWLLSLPSTGFRPTGFSSCGLLALALGLSSCGAQAHLLRGTWDLLDQGLNRWPLH